MKKYVLFILLVLLMGLEIVKAETFVEGKFISGEYISKKMAGK